MFRISLAQWSLHRSIESGKVSKLEFPRLAKETFGIDAVELVNTLMESHREDSVNALRRLCDDCGVDVLLIMCDDEGDLSAPDRGARLQAARNHDKWLDAAAALGCHAIRVNTGPENGAIAGDTAAENTAEDAIERCAESCRAILERAAPLELAVLIENHGGLSADVDLLVRLVERVDHPLFGTLPDFGNFPAGVDRYAAVERMMPHARAVSAKCLDFDDETGDERTFDFCRLLGIVRRAGYRGALGIEYEGERLDEFEGVRRAKRLIERWMASGLA